MWRVETLALASVVIVHINCQNEPTDTNSRQEYLSYIYSVLLVFDLFILDAVVF